MLGAIPLRAKHDGGLFFAGFKPLPIPEIERLNAAQSGRIAGLKAAKLERQADAVSLSNPEGSNALPVDLKNCIQDVAEQLAVRCLVTPEPGKPPAPEPRVWRYLQAIDSLRSRLNAGQLAEAAHDLHGAIAASEHPALDKELLQDVISEITRPDGMPLNRFMAAKVFDGLCLGQLKMKEGDEREPSSRTYNSILPNLAQFALPYGMGRTLLLEGARQLFEGPSQAKRGERLEKLMAAFPQGTHLDFSDPMSDPLDEHDVYVL